MLVLGQYRFVLEVAVCTLLLGTTTAIASERPSSGAVDACPAWDQTLASFTDYRLRDSTSQLQWNTADIKRNHYDPAIARLNSGEISERVLGDLNFILARWPNHYPALEAVIRYDLAGGKIYGFLSTRCYLERAQNFAPDDITVLLYKGYYYWKTHDLQRAIDSYAEALQINPNSADAHYNLGLVYLEISQYDQAFEHAHAAYESGYPLPGLRNKLKQAGHWKDAETATAR